MAGTLQLRDENLAGETLHEWAMVVLTETLTVRELIRGRVYQEVQDNNVRQQTSKFSLIKLDPAEEALNGTAGKRAKLLDWQRPFARAVEAFEKSQFLVLVNDRQAEDLEQAVVVAPDTRVTFLKLTPLVGG